MPDPASILAWSRVAFIVAISFFPVGLAAAPGSFALAPFAASLCPHWGFILSAMV